MFNLWSILKGDKCQEETLIRESVERVPGIGEEVIQEGSTEKVTFEQRLKRAGGASHAYIQGRTF